MKIIEVVVSFMSVLEDASGGKGNVYLFAQNKYPVFMNFSVEPLGENIRIELCEKEKNFMLPNLKISVNEIEKIPKEKYPFISEICVQSIMIVLQGGGASP